MARILDGLNEEDRGTWQVMTTSLLSAIVHGEVDAVQMAREELAARGLDRQGRWVGFKAAEQMHGTERVDLFAEDLGLRTVDSRPAVCTHDSALCCECFWPKS